MFKHILTVSNAALCGNDLSCKFTIVVSLWTGVEHVIGVTNYSGLKIEHYVFQDGYQLFVTNIGLQYK